MRLEVMSTLVFLCSESLLMYAFKRATSGSLVMFVLGPTDGRSGESEFKKINLTDKLHSVVTTCPICILPDLKVEHKEKSRT